MFPFEVLASGYGALLGVAALLLRRARHRGRAFLGGIALASSAWAVSTIDPPGLIRLFVLPLLYIGAGYWIPAMLLPADRPRQARSTFEEWLVRSDARLRPRLPDLPPAVRTFAEVAYLACYPLVPICLGLVWLRGDTADVAEYWTTVLGAGFACYVSLPWLVSRPPSLLQPDAAAAHASRAAPAGIARLNRWVLSRVSHTWTTFPSGHVAVSCAAAAALARVWPAAGAVAAVVAAGVAIGAAAGRYHFVVDVLTGLLVALLIVVIT